MFAALHWRTTLPQYGDMGLDLLTLIIPTHNRARHCAAQLYFLLRQGVRHRILVADSSDAPDAEMLRVAYGETVKILPFPPEIRPLDKFVEAVAAADTPYVAMMPDDDITFPRSIERCLEHLVAHEDTVAAHGYVLDIAIRSGEFDMPAVRWFSPTIGEDDPLQRLYHLLRRYQPFVWAVFRRDALLLALQRAQDAKLIFAQELTILATAVLLGKVARLPVIYTMRGEEVSGAPQAQWDPFFTLLDDSEMLGTEYRRYRDRLIELIAERGLSGSHPLDALPHTLNLMHMIFLRPLLDAGLLNHTARLRLGDALPSLVPSLPAHDCGPIGAEDIVIRSPRHDRTYVWRHAVLAAEPREEIVISSEERDCALEALDDYDLIL
jgi:glycosyltransferase domain-containing protein